MNNKFWNSVLAIFVTASLLVASFQSSVAMADSEEHHDRHSMSRENMSPEKIHEYIKRKLDKFAERLEIKSSQQTAWEEYAKSVEMLAEQSAKKPSEDADAATIAQYRAEKATAFAKKLTVIAEATSKLQGVLTEDQKKTFNQIARHSHHMRCHGWSHSNGEQGWGDHGHSEQKKSLNGHSKQKTN